MQWLLRSGPRQGPLDVTLWMAGSLWHAQREAAAPGEAIQSCDFSMGVYGRSETAPRFPAAVTTWAECDALLIRLCPPQTI